MARQRAAWIVLALGAIALGGCSIGGQGAPFADSAAIASRQHAQIVSLPLRDAVYFSGTQIRRSTGGDAYRVLTTTPAGHEMSTAEYRTGFVDAVARILAERNATVVEDRDHEIALFEQGLPIGDDTTIIVREYVAAGGETLSCAGIDRGSRKAAAEAPDGDLLQSTRLYERTVIDDSRSCCRFSQRVSRETGKIIRSEITVSLPDLFDPMRSQENWSCAMAALSP